jgi:RNA polymerase sigma-70 factor (ECF subfamily)
MSAEHREEMLAEAFQGQRRRLLAMSYRMLGSRADAEDAVQEAWLRLTRQDSSAIDNLSGWLTTVVGRVCIDTLRARRNRSERPYEDAPPELMIAPDHDGSPEDDAVLAESVGLALLVVLESLEPAERLAFVLHDTFAVPFDEIGQIIGRSSDAAKMLASRARRKVHDAPHSDGTRQEQRALVDAFLAAARGGDFEGLLRLLDPQVMSRTYTAHGVIVKLGATEVAAAALHGGRVKAIEHNVIVNGDPGIVARSTSGKLLGVMACAIVDGRIAEIIAVTDPERLAALQLSDSFGD